MLTVSRSRSTLIPQVDYHIPASQTETSGFGSKSMVFLIVFVSHGISLVPVVRSEISAGISVVSAMWHLWLVAVSLVSLPLTRWRQIKPPVGIPLWIWPSSISFHFLHSTIAPFSSHRILALLASERCCVPFLCRCRSALCYLHAILFSFTFHQRPLVASLLLSRNVSMNHLRLSLLLGQALYRLFRQSPLAPSHCCRGKRTVENVTLCLSMTPQMACDRQLSLTPCLLIRLLASWAGVEGWRRWGW